MPDLYAYRLPLPGEGAVRFGDAVDVTCTTLTSCLDAAVSGDHGSAASERGTLRWRTVCAPDGAARVWSALWEAADPGDEGTTWTVTVKIALDGDRAYVLVRVGLLSRGFRMSRVKLGVDPLPLVSALVGALGAEEDHQPLVAQPWHADADDTVAHLADLLLDPNRALPVVVVSSNAGPAVRSQPGPLVDPEAVARSLVGVAHVAVLDSPSASFALTRLIGPSFAVFDGAVRLYWPGLTSTSRPHDHILWLPSALGRNGTGWLRRILLDLLMPVAVIRFSTAALEAGIALATERRRRDELRTLWEEARKADLSEEWEQELEAAWSENERLRKERDILAGQLAAALDNLRTMARTWHSQPEPEQGPEPHTSTDRPSSVLQAVEWAAQRCAQLVILDDAFESARRATYRQPGRVWMALRAMDTAATAWQRDDLPGGFKNAFARSGFDYGHSLGVATLGRHTSEYERTYDGRRIVLGPHLRLGRGSPEACCRIYFHFDQERRVCVVGHVGNHLSDRSTG